MENSIEKVKLNLGRMYIDDDPSGCGYCKEGTDKKKQSYSFGFVVDKYPPKLYEEMMFCGWRRCGNYTYKPNLAKSCCKLYTCRLNVLDYKISKQQKKVMKNFRKYLKGELDKDENKNKKQPSEPNKDKNEKNNKSLEDKYTEIILKSLIDFIKTQKYFDKLPNCDKVNKFHENQENIQKIKVLRNNDRKYGDYSSNIIILISNYYSPKEENIKIEKNKTDKKMKKQTSSEQKQKIFSILFDLLKSYYESNKECSNYLISLSNNTGHVNFTIKDKDNYEKYLKDLLEKPNKDQIKNNSKKESKNIIKEKTDKKIYKLDYFEELVTTPELYEEELKHKYTLELTSDIALKKNDERFNVYKKYQTNIHGDKPSKIKIDGYNDSWGETNLIKNKNSLIPLPKDLANKTKHPELYPKYYGTYNLIHRIDGKIVAVGIWDVLPTSLSSVYLYYDTDYSFLDIGVFTAVREIEYMREFNKLIDPNFKYYVMGFYIDTCQKMRYKGYYHPTEILDPFTMNFVYLDDVREIIKDNKIHKLSDKKTNPKFQSLNNKEIDDIYNNTLVQLYGKNTAPLNVIVYMFGEEKTHILIERTVKRFFGLLGKYFISFFDLILE